MVLTTTPRATAHSHADDNAEREYDRLRDLARAEASKRNSCFDKVRLLPRPPRVVTASKPRLT